MRPVIALRFESLILRATPDIKIRQRVQVALNFKAIKLRVDLVVKI